MGSMTFTFMETEELKITSLDFTATGGIITANVRNTGTTDVIIISGTSNGAAGTMAADVEIAAGAEGSVALSGLTFVDGTAYNVQLQSSKGNKFAYTGTATVDSA
jgi:hypothetical protein